MKTCSKCKIEKEAEEFCTNNKAKDKLNYACRECSNEQNRNSYRDPEKLRGYNKKAHQERKKRYYNILYKYIACSNTNGQPTCDFCGFTHSLFAPFDWHHMDASIKEYEVSSMVRHTEENIIRELDKCVLLCACCHRLHHYKENSNETN